MPAFNRRIRPKEYYGVSAYAFFCFMTGAVFTGFAFIPVKICHYVFPPLALIFFVLTFIAFLLHKDALFLGAIFDSRKDFKCRPNEAIDEW